MDLAETVAQNDEKSHKMRAENKGLHEPAEFGKEHDTKSPTSDRLDFCNLFIIKTPEQTGFATGAVLQSKKKTKTNDGKHCAFYIFRRI